MEPSRLANAKKYSEIGKKYFQERRYLLALEMYCAALSIDPLNVQYLIDRANSYRILDKEEKAISDLDEALKLARDNAEALRLRGLCRKVCGMLNEAKEDFSNYLKQFPTSEIQIDLKDLQYLITKKNAYISSQTKGPEDALSKLNFLIRKCPRSLKYKRKKLKILKIHDHNQCRTYCQQVLREHEITPYIGYLESDFLMKEGQRFEAYNLLEEVLYLDPDYKHANILMKKIKDYNENESKGIKLMNRKKYIEAIKLFSPIIDEPPAYACIYSLFISLRANAHFHINELLKADKDITYALKSFQKIAENILLSGRIHLRLNNFQRALERFREAQEMDKNIVGIHEYIEMASNGKNEKINLYNVLGVNENVEPMVLKEMFKSKFNDWEERLEAANSEERNEAKIVLTEVAEAYFVLSDLKRKKIFDETGNCTGMLPSDFNPFKIYKSFINE